MKENTGVIILGSTNCALGQFFRPRNPEALKSWCLVLQGGVTDHLLIIFVKEHDNVSSSWANRNWVLG